MILPQHIGIIMDGNGRWATALGKRRTDGHLEGVKTTKKIVEQAQILGIKYLSLYVFSTENWRRTEEEVVYLMKLLTLHLRAEYEFYRKNNIRVVHSGDLGRLPSSVQDEIRGVEEDTRYFDGLVVNLLINYGGRDEICRAVKRLIAERLPITEEGLKDCLDQKLPDLDLVIRTGGEQRLSNFMLWQSSYAEYFFSPKLWPDFTTNDFNDIILDYTGRQRRFGGV